MAGTHKRWQHQAEPQRKLKGKRRHRPVKSVREKERQPVVRETMVSFRAKGSGEPRDTTLLTSVLHRMYEHGDRNVTVRVATGTRHATNLLTLKRVFGDSKLEVLTAAGLTRTCKLREVCMLNMLGQTERGKQIVRLKIRRVRKRCDRDGVKYLDQLLTKLAATRYGGAQELRALQYPALEWLWGRAKGLNTHSQRETAARRLNEQAVRGWGVSLRARPTARIPGTWAFPRKAVQAGMRALYDGLGLVHRPQVRRLATRTRIVQEAPPQVGRLLGNWRKWSTQTYVPGQEPICTCALMPEVRVHSNVINGHLAMRGRDYRGPGERALRCGAKTQVAVCTEESEVPKNIWKTIAGLANSLPAGTKNEVTPELIRFAVDVGVREAKMHTPAPRNHDENEPTEADIRAVRARFREQIISEIDKERGELCVLCPVTQYRVMESAFPRDGDRYILLDPDDEPELIQGDIDHAVTAGWEAMGDLYGVEWRADRRRTKKKRGRRKQRRVPGKCEIARGYGTIKGKSWRPIPCKHRKRGRPPRRKVKGRPITPHTKYVLKRISNTVARAHHVLLGAVCNKRVARMYTT